MRVLGLDPGRKRIGVAVSDELGLTAQPVATISRGTNVQTLERLRVALADAVVESVVVGLPLRLDGSEGGAARRAREFAELVSQELELPAEMWDERFTSVQADRLLIEAGVRRKDRKGKTDRLAAAIMLQSFLDAHRESWRDDE